MNEDELKELINRYIQFKICYNQTMIIEKSFSDIYSNIKSFVNFEFNYDFNMLKCNLYLLNTVIQKEKYIQTNEMKLNENFIDMFIGSIVEERYPDNSFRICNKKFKSGVDFLNLVRNKFAHGEFKYDSDNKDILMMVDNQDFYFPYEWLKKYNELILFYEELYRKNGNYKEIIVMYPTNLKKINTFKEFKNGLKKIKYMEFNISLRDEKEVTLSLLKIYNEIQKLFNNLDSKKEVEKEKQIIKDICDKNNLNLSIETKYIINSDTSEEIRKKIYNIFNSYSDFTSYNRDVQFNFIAQNVIEILKQFDIRDYTTYGIAYLLNYIDEISKYKGNISFQRYSKENKNILLNFDKVRNMVIINKFNMLFNYNLEEIYNKYLDYSLFDLSKIEEKINFFEDEELTKLENKQNSIIDQLIKLYNDINLKIEKLNNLMNAKILYNKQGKIDNNLDFIEQEILDFQNKINELELKLENIKKERKEHENNICINSYYFKNKNVLIHIRNSIAHGTFEVIPKIENSELSDYIIIFKDIYKGKITYEAQINSNDYYNLIKIINNEINTMFYRIIVNNQDKVKKIIKR